MKVEVANRPSSTSVAITLPSHSKLTVQSGAMIAMDVGLSVETNLLKRGGWLGMGKRLLTGEGLFLSEFSSDSQERRLWLAPTLIGDVICLDVKSPLIVQAGSFLAMDSHIQMDSQYKGLKSLFAGESLFWIRLSGQGLAILEAFGCVEEVAVSGEMIVDSGHIVAFTEGLDFQVTKMGKSWFTSFLGGEGFVTKFKGHGTVWIQSHNPPAFGHSLTPFLKPRRS